MLLGEHEHTIDDKNRLTLPARFRAAFAEGVVLTRGMDGCLYAYRRDDWDKLVDSRLGATVSAKNMGVFGRAQALHEAGNPSKDELMPVNCWIIAPPLATRIEDVMRD